MNAPDSQTADMASISMKGGRILLEIRQQGEDIHVKVLPADR